MGRKLFKLCFSIIDFKNSVFLKQVLFYQTIYNHNKGLVLSIIQ